MLSSKFSTFINKKSVITVGSSVRNYAFKSDLKIKWVRPEKIPFYKPEKTGDLKPLPTLSKDTVVLEFQDSQELKTANDIVKKLFTVEFAPAWKTRRMATKLYVDNVKRHELDLSSPEAKIAKYTGSVRYLQEVMDRFPRNKYLKVRLNELIHKRHKHLKILRQVDYKCFEWLLEKLDIVYKPDPVEPHKVTRKDSLRKLTQLHCDKLRDDKLNEYRLALESEQPAFLEEKIQVLEHIRNEEQELGLPVTIEQKEIDDAKLQLAELLEKQNVRK